MTERTVPPAPASDGRSAGQMLRDARLATGLDVATLAGTMKVPAAKIEAIEAERFEALPGIAFTRGLALALCRTLKIDPQAVLDRLPRSDGQTLDEVSRGINAPFREPHGGLAALDLSLLRRPIVWGPLVFAVGALLLWWLPVVPLGDRAAQWLAGGTGAGGATAPASPGMTVEPVVVAPAAVGASAAPSGLPVESTRVEVVHASPPVAPPLGAPASPATAASGAAAIGAPPAIDAATAASTALTLRSSGTSWVEVRDARGAVLLSRTLQAGESVGLTGSLPLQAVVGNAAQTSAVVRGQPMDIAPFTRDNVARFEVR